MSEDRRKGNKHCTGTVPKAKSRNNSANERDSPRSLTNNLQSDSEYQNFIRNPRRNPRNNYYPMDATLDENQANGRVTPNSSRTSRRNSSTLKCDNVTKYPDKKQIEDKLTQIREYLRITSSLMATMKNTDEQDDTEMQSVLKMNKDLKDSEAKLLDILESMENEEKSGVQITEVNGSDIASEPSTSSRNNDNSDGQEFDAIREEQMMLLKLQQSAENKLRDARLAQEKLRMAQGSNEIKNAFKKRECVSEQDFDEAIKELEERAKRLNEPRIPNSRFEDKFLQDVDALQSQILIMHDANDERAQLIEVLDNRDQELRSQHVELENKLHDLQAKKQQVDLLVAQMQSFENAEEEDDMGGQVRKIVSMKDELNKLKDMLETVKTAENMPENDLQETAENFLQNNFQNVKPRPNQQNDSNMLRYDNNTNENRQKQVNKNTREQQSRGASIKSRTASINELEAKKRELEDLMGKHKAGTSNLNHDIGADTKSDFSCNNSINEGVWIPLSHLPSQSMSSNHLSSDECQDDVNEYSVIPDAHHLSHHQAAFYPMQNQPRVDYPPSNYEGARRMQSCTPERNVRGSSASTSTVYMRDRPRSTNEQRDNKSQINKQLQLIKSVCESMLEQQTLPPQNNHHQQPPPQPLQIQPTNQLRNNLTPSPLYSEPRRFASPLNTLASSSVATSQPPNLESHLPWNNSHSNQHHQEMNNYQGWLATNTLQTQSFMLNTLNQCCQMLWLQQRELQSLRSTVTALQDRVDGAPSDTLPPLSNPNLPPPLNPYRPQTQNHHPQHVPSKIPHVAAACSLPNLNHFNPHPSHPQPHHPLPPHHQQTPPHPPPPSNLDLTYVNNQNVATSRLLDPACLNNTTNLHHQHDNLAISNNNAQLPGQLWNGPALNNQVPPGNRANNYWDNFRSYSRQNLLSTKNNEVLPSSMDRSNSSSERTNPFTLMALSKSNSEHESTSTSQENTPQRRLPFRHNDTTSVSSAIQPDVLNVNTHVAKFNDQSDLTNTANAVTSDNIDDLQMSFQMLLNSYHDEAGSNHSNASEERTSGSDHGRARRNEWNNDVQPEPPQKSKLFDELRENVYKEVASLISANEARPHFLIQLFRDLQMIGSDHLRTKILQSIQNTITNSLVNSQNLSRMSSEFHSSENRSAELLWTRRRHSTQRTLLNMEQVDIGIQGAFKGILEFLNEHNESVIDQDVINAFNKKLLETESFQNILTDTIFQRHFSNILNEVLAKYVGKILSDVRAHLIQDLGDFLRGELSFIQLIQETSPENYQGSVSINDNANVHFKTPLFELQNINSDSPQLHNGDLAEADQSRGEEDDADEEGAVGGYLELPHENGDFHIVQSISEELDVPTIDFLNNGEGLDQVPTRLPTSVRSRSTTPNRDSREGDNF